MRITIKSNFGITGLDNDELELEGYPTLSDVLSELAESAEYPFLCQDGQIDPDVEILLNGLEYAFLPQRLNTLLNEGDKIQILMLALGGG